MLLTLLTIVVLTEQHWSNPAWPEGVQDIRKVSRESLGCAAKVSE